MDRNSIIGLTLIGAIMIGFSIFSQPSDEEIKEQQKKEQAEVKAKKEQDKKLADTKKAETTKSTKSTATSALKPVVKGNLIKLESDKLRVFFNTKGGSVAAVYLKEFQTYTDYVKKDTVFKPLRLFGNGDATNQLVFPLNGKTIKTGSLLFDIKEMTKNAIVFSLDLGNGQTIEQRYALKDNSYDLDYTIGIHGFSGKVNPKNFMFDWKASFLRTERHVADQRRVSTICYDYKNDGFDYLSETKPADNAEAKDAINWIAFKQSYFSSILQPDNGFGKDGSKFSFTSFDKKDPKNWEYIKNYKTTANLNIADAGNATVHMSWFFGPNDYDVLHSYNKDYDDILNLGWGLFRWINVYAVQPVFSLLVRSGVSVGLAIFLLTVVLKVVLMPIQWKMYVSSAKMRILKPEIDEINAKYPNQEDAMKKQMEVMALYRESGASQLAGCVPMLIQMPILLAVFRFFPASFALRQQPFLWAEDLSSYDSILNFGFSIWPYGDHVSLFALLMSATTIIYSVLNGGNMQQPQQPGMPNMKLLMYIFPIMMIFFFNSYSAGLSYYYFISTLMSIVIMILIKQFFVDEEKLKLKMAEHKASNTESGKTKKKSKFQERLEQMQKLQQEQMKNKKK